MSSFGRFIRELSVTDVVRSSKGPRPSVCTVGWIQTIMELSEIGAAFLVAMQSRAVSHPRFTGQRLDPSGLTPKDLGRLLPIAVRMCDNASGPQAARAAAQQVVWQATLIAPEFSAEDARAFLRFCAPAELHRLHGAGFILKVLARRREELCDLSEVIAPHLLRAGKGNSDANCVQEPHGWLLLASLCKTPETELLADAMRKNYASSPLLLDELEVMLSLPRRDAIMLARLASPWMGRPRNDSDLEVPGTYPLAQLPTYMVFAQRALAKAMEKVSRVHAGFEPYAADKAFTPFEGQVLGRCVRAALDQREPWLDAVLGPLWKNTSVAPGQAKTMPSQSVAIALGRAVEEMPNASAISAMREVTGAVRHAGIKKKLLRMLRTAERRLAERPDVILQLPSDAKLTQTTATAVRRSMELLYRGQRAFTFEDWQRRFSSHKEVFSTASNLIWRITQPCQEPFGAIPILTSNQLSWRLGDGTAHAADTSQSIMLWHPLVAEVGERDVWRDHIMTARIEQPFLQAFRQFYRPVDDELQQSSTAMFADHTVAMKSVMGVAQSIGWVLERDVGLSLRIGTNVFQFNFDRSLYPGYDGTATTRLLRVYQTAGKDARLLPAALATIDPVVLSEVLRNIDLLTSVGTFAHKPHATAALANMRRRKHGSVGLYGFSIPRDPVVVPVGQSADIRREVLRRLYARASDVSVAARHVEALGYKIHIATARVTRNGEPVELALPMADGSVVWLPHDDEVLFLIVQQVHFIRHAAG